MGRHQGIRRHDRRLICYNRRALIAGLAATLLAPRRARAASVTDGGGRAVPVPARVERVFPARPPAAIFLYTLAPELLISAARQPAGETRIPFARHLRPARRAASPDAATPPISKSCSRSTPTSSGLRKAGGPQAGGSRMHRARDHGHPWPHVAQGSRALHQGFQPREAGALGDGETRQRNGNAEGEELACQNVRSWGEPDTPGWRE